MASGGGPGTAAGWDANNAWATRTLTRTLASIPLFGSPIADWEWTDYALACVLFLALALVALNTYLCKDLG